MGDRLIGTVLADQDSSDDATKSANNNKNNDENDDEQQQQQDEDDDEQNEDEDEDEDKDEDEDEDNHNEKDDHKNGDHVNLDVHSDSNNLFALRTPGTLAGSALMGAAFACVVHFVRIKLSDMRKPAEVAGYTMLEV